MNHTVLYLNIYGFARGGLVHPADDGAVLLARNAVTAF